MSHQDRFTNGFFDPYLDVAYLRGVLDRVAPFGDRDTQVHVEISSSRDTGYEISATAVVTIPVPAVDIINHAHVLEFLHAFNPQTCGQLLDKYAANDKRLTEATAEIERLAKQVRGMSNAATGKRAELRVLLSWLRTKAQRAKVAGEAGDKLEQILAGFDS